MEAHVKTRIYYSGINAANNKIVISNDKLWNNVDVKLWSSLAY